jgi:hypothetical protein
MPEVLENSTVSFPQGAVSMENDTLKATGAGGFIYSTNWSDYTLTFRFKTGVAPGNFWCGLAFRCDSSWTSGTWPQNSYILQLGYQGRSDKIWKVVDGTFTLVASEDREITLNVWHDVRLDAQGSSLKVYLDNQLLLSATDGSLTNGSIGLLNCSGPVYFDDVTKT